MPDTTLSLGPIVFRDFEIPSAITFGGRQRIAVHYLSTGRRVTDVLGPDDASISFAGVLSGPMAADRLREIDMLRKLGQPLTLAWNTFTYSVLIATFQAAYKTQSWIPYKIFCWVVDDAAFIDLGSILPATDQALASLDSMYNVVPATLLPIPDARCAIASCVSGGKPANLTAISASLLASQVVLRAEQKQREASAEMLQADRSKPVSQFISDFGSITKAAEDLQFLAQSQDCIGQAAAYLRQGY